MGAPLLHIGHWHNDCIVARDHPAPGQAQAQLDRLARRLPDELAGGLYAWFRDGGERVVLIRHLEFDCELDLSCDAGLLASRWAQRFARTLATAIDAGEQMLTFPDPAAYRARFISDLAHGRAWDAWYYPGFAGLRPLPAGAAIRTVLLEEAELGRATLRALPDAAWPALADVLGGAEAGRIVDALCRGPAALSSDAATLDATLHRAQQLLAPGTPQALHALAIVAAALQRQCAPGDELALWAHSAARLRALPGAGVAAVRAALADDGSVADEAARTLAHTLRERPAWRDVLLAPHTPAGPDASAGQAGLTAFAGMALLLQELDELLDERLSAALPAGSGLPARALAAWLALCHAAGAPRCAVMMNEGFWRDFFGLPASLALEDIVAAHAGQPATTALRELARQADNRARGPAAHAPLLRAPQRDWLRIDSATGIWCEWTGRPPASEHPPSLLGAARRARREWRQLDAGLPLPADWRRFVVQLAQIALRRFAWRVPGFASSSLPFLHANFLAGAGRCDAAGCLALSRPPLHALLNLTGIARARPAWSGPPARTLRLEYLP